VRKVIGTLVKAFGDRFFSPVNTRCAKSGITKIQINLLAIATGCASGIAYAAAWAQVGWALLVVHGFLDYFDGGTRRTGVRSMQEFRFFGWDTHVVADKAGEVAIFAGLAIGGIVSPWLALLALASSLGVTIFGQILQKQEKIDLERSLFERADRILVILILGFLVNYSIALIVVCGMNAVLFVQRSVESVHATD
jgi:phosphatidylglycerophosphate synthase